MKQRRIFERDTLISSGCCPWMLPFPPVPLGHLFVHMNCHDLYCCMLVCKQWSITICTSRSLWTSVAVHFNLNVELSEIENVHDARRRLECHLGLLSWTKSPSLKPYRVRIAKYLAIHQHPVTCLYSGREG
jgi:hypothetical protein